MMVSNLDLSTLIAQIPEAQRIQMAQIAHPEVQQTLAGELMLRRQRKNRKRVRKTRACDTDGRIHDDDQNAGPRAGERCSGQTPDDKPERDQGLLIDTTV